MGKRRSSRELSLKFLYQVEFDDEDIEGQIERFIEGNQYQPEVSEYLRELVTTVRSHMKEIDLLIEKFSQHWTLDRMTLIDRNILRLGVCELLHIRDVPAKVAINEAVDIAKRYGSEESPDFINGILDKIYKEGRKDLAHPPI